MSFNLNVPLLFSRYIGLVFIPQILLSKNTSKQVQKVAWSARYIFIILPDDSLSILTAGSRRNVPETRDSHVTCDLLLHLFLFILIDLPSDKLDALEARAGGNSSDRFRTRSYQTLHEHERPNLLMTNHSANRRRRRTFCSVATTILSRL